MVEDYARSFRLATPRVQAIADVAALVTDTSADRAGIEAIRRTGTDVIVAG
jgi:DeoR family transcriptional regulator of aga operon